MFSILLQAKGGSPGWTQLVLFAGIGIIFYFFMILPQQRKAKAHKAWIDELKTGDKVVTAGGLHGTVSSSTDKTIVIEVDKGVKLTFEKGSISMDSSKKL